jgi:hypothetical protein
MQSTVHKPKASEKRASSHPPARMLFVAFAVFAAIAIAPRMRSATPPAAPTFTQTNLVSESREWPRRSTPIW